MTDQEIAQASAEIFWAGDRFSAMMGFEMVAVGPGRGVVRSEVRSDHLNVHDAAHGGMMFALASSAFGLACNSRGIKTVAQTVSVVYADRATQGDVLTATALEVSTTGKTGIYDITLARADGSQVALLRGVARQLSGSYLAE